MERIVILGDGLLGAEIRKQTGWDILSRKKDNFDITDISSFDMLIDWCEDGHLGNVIGSPKYTTVINCIAFTDTYSSDRDRHWNTNYKGVADLVDFCNKWGMKLVHISTTYVYVNSKSEATEQDIPVHQATHYAYTKLLADGYIELRAKDYLVVRVAHKPRPFPFNRAWINQQGNFDYVDVVAKLIIEVIAKKTTGVLNLGTELKNMYQLAKQTRADVEPLLIHDELIPKDFSVSLDRLKSILTEV